MTEAASAPRPGAAREPPPSSADSSASTENGDLIRLLRMIRHSRRLLAALLAWTLVTGGPKSTALCAGEVPVPILRGTLVDLSHNHGADNRLYSHVLGEKRDLYVYLPPGYKKSRRYPVLLWLHGYMADERQALYTVLPALDDAIARGTMPPVVAAFPDGSISGDFHYVGVGSWWIDSRRGKFQTYLIKELLPLMESTFSASDRPEDRMIAGWSMGGFGAYNLVLKHPELAYHVAAVSPPLNLRYVGCSGDYFQDFRPNCWRMRSSFTGLDVVGRYFGGLVKVRAWWVIYPVWGRGAGAVSRITAENPLDILLRDRPDLSRHHLLVLYGRRDEMNLDAQIESFLYVAAQLGITVDARAYPDGTHSERFMAEVVSQLLDWLGASVRTTATDLAKGGHQHNQRRAATAPTGRSLRRRQEPVRSAARRGTLDSSHPSPRS